MERKEVSMWKIKFKVSRKGLVCEGDSYGDYGWGEVNEIRNKMMSNVIK